MTFSGRVTHCQSQEIVEGVSASSKLICKVSCQCCDAHVCMPPLEKEFVLTVK